MLDVLCSLSNLLIGLIVLWNPFSNNIELSLISLFSTSVCMCSNQVFSSASLTSVFGHVIILLRSPDVTACHGAPVPAMPLPPRKRRERDYSN